MNYFWKNKKVVVTGAGGFIGRYAVEALLNRGAIVTAVLSSRSLRKEGDFFKQKNLSILKTDLLLFENCLQATKNQDILLNFAAIDGGSFFKQQHPAKIYHGNITMTSNMLEAAVQNNIGRILLMSSVDVYPSDKQGILKEEDAFFGEPAEKIEGYAWAKRFLEISARMYYKEYGIKIAIARVGNVYGAGDDPSKGRVIPTFISKAIAGEKIMLTVDPDKKISFLHVSDLIPALLDLVEHHVVCDPVNLVSKQYISLQELATLIIHLAGSQSEVITKGLQNQQRTDRFIIVEKAEKIINFKENITVREGLVDLIGQEKKHHD